jgi:hypothetical protein
MCVVWPNDTDDSQSMPMWICARPRGGRDAQVAAARRAGADEHRVPVLAEQLLHRLDAHAAAELDAQRQHVAGLFVDHLFGQRKRGICERIMPPALRRHRTRHVVAQRREVARHRQRRGPGADAGDALAVLHAAGRGMRLDDARP